MVNMQDLKKLEKIMKSRFLKWQPNRCITVYKNRGGEYTKCKIWVYIEYSTMRVHDLFCTDEDYQILEDAEEQGLDVVNAINDVDTDNADRPTDDLTMNVSIIEE